MQSVFLNYLVVDEHRHCCCAETTYPGARQRLRSAWGWRGKAVQLQSEGCSHWSAPHHCHSLTGPQLEAYLHSLAPDNGRKGNSKSRSKTVHAVILLGVILCWSWTQPETCAQKLETLQPNWDSWGTFQTETSKAWAKILNNT